MIDTKTDGHVHTRLCHHASGEMEEYVLAAIERDLDRVVFLEHLEAGIDYFESTWLTDTDFAYYHSEGRRLQEKYWDRIEIGLGVEVGYNPSHIDEIKRRLDMHSWDCIGLSYHFLATGSGHLNMVSRKQVNLDASDRFGPDEVITRYYRDLINAVEYLPGQVLCHMDAVLRHHPTDNHTEAHDSLIDDLLDAAATRNMALEVNTSGYRTRGEPFPSMDILRKAVKRKMKLVAGSDAHRPEDVGRYFDRLPELTEELGVR